MTIQEADMHHKALSDPVPIHPLGSRAKVLLTSVFGPYAKDDEYGSRAINPMERWPAWPMSCTSGASGGMGTTSTIGSRPRRSSGRRRPSLRGRSARTPRPGALWLGLCIVLAIPTAGWAVEDDGWRVRPHATTRTVVTTTRLSGPGAGVPGLPQAYDMSLFEQSWGGRQATVGGAGVTTNTSYPLVDGAAISTKSELGAQATSGRGLSSVFKGRPTAWPGTAPSVGCLGPTARGIALTASAGRWSPRTARST